MSVLRRLIELPDDSGVPSAQRLAWKSHLKDLPALPLSAAKQGGLSPNKLAPIEPERCKNCPRLNSENTELYSVHPFRIFGVGKPNVELAQQTYSERMSPCNDGW